MPWVCLLLKHNSASMEMTGSNTLLPTWQISVNKAGAVETIARNTPLPEAHPTLSTGQEHFLKCHSGKHHLLSSPAPQGSSFNLIQFSTTHTGFMTHTLTSLQDIKALFYSSTEENLPCGSLPSPSTPKLPGCRAGFQAAPTPCTGCVRRWRGGGQHPQEDNTLCSDSQGEPNNHNSTAPAKQQINTSLKQESAEIMQTEREWGMPSQLPVRMPWVLLITHIATVAPVIPSC